MRLHWMLDDGQLATRELTDAEMLGDVRIVTVELSADDYAIADKLRMNQRLYIDTGDGELAVAQICCMQNLKDAAKPK